jgi:hypothetical protein
MTRAATPMCVLADDPCAENVLLWTSSARRRAAARVGNAGGAGAGSRPPRRPGGRVMVWPKRFWPQRAADIDTAIAQTWRLYSHGIINAVELAVRDTELRIMREWIS